MILGRWSAGFAVVICLASASFAQLKNEPKAPVLTARQIADKFKYSVFTIETDKGTGTGFRLYTNQILTCLHVIKGASSVSARITDRPPIALPTIFSLSEKADSSLLSMSETAGNAVVLGNPDDVHAGDRIYVIGSPRGLEQTITEGLISAIRQEDGVTLFQLSAAVSPGSSGSPVINDRGEVIGMVTSQYKDGQQLNFAVSIYAALSGGAGIPLSKISFSDSASETPPVSPGAATTSNLSALDELLTIEDEIEKKSVKNRELYKAPDFYILVEDIPEALKDLVSASDVEGWVTAELHRSAPALKVLTSEEMNKRDTSWIGTKSVFDLAKKYDAKYRHLYVNISCMKTKTDMTFYSVDLHFKREGFGPNGSMSGAVWSDGTNGYFGASYSPSTMIRDGVVGVTQRFGDAWTLANP